jgi:4-diphosphocytidyl-2-C-methyl-D-erythritol kinase
MRVSLAPVAKINLRLLVLAREDSGFHSLETIFCAISLQDRLEVARGTEGIDLVVAGSIPVGRPEDNLVRRAAVAFHEELGTAPAVSIRLEKVIPAAAGLGGGSSDAASTLRALNVLHGEPLDATKLLQIGARLGSDVPFFLGPSPFALAWGRGERLLQLQPPAARPVLLVDAGVQLPTGPAFEALDAIRSASPEPVAPVALDPMSLASWDELAAIAHNDFEAVAQERIPRFEQFIRLLQSHGAFISMLSGSGSAIFGIFESVAAAHECQREFAKIGVVTRSATTLSHWPAPFCRD